jgi:sortase A
MLYSYQKSYENQKPTLSKKVKDARENVRQHMPKILIAFGILAIGSVGYPMLTYQNNSPTKELIAIQEPVSANTPEIIDIDYTKVSNWFTGLPKTSSKTTPNFEVKNYSLTIPKLDISGANVAIDSEDLAKSLIHYQGTAIPGQLGSPVIFGHSTLLSLYNPENYLSIFSKLPTLTKNDKIILQYDGVTYTYQVDSYFEVEPKQVEVLEQDYTQRTLTLITCVPPGTYLRRGVIKAKLVSEI